MRPALAVVLLSFIISTAHAKPGQTLPDFRRQREIRLAMQSHEYAPGRTWPETVFTLKQIAREHHWQTNRAPDARVLILLGLGNKGSDSDILNWPPSKLEPGILAEKRVK